MWKIVLGTIGIFIVLGFVSFGIGLFTKSATKVVDTVVENEVYERSFQNQAGKREKIAIEEANLAEIEMRLSNPSLDEETKNNLEAQRSAARIRLQIAKEN